jgi:hypothetical protein
LLFGRCHRRRYGCTLVAATRRVRLLAAAAYLNFRRAHVRARRENRIARHRCIVTLFLFGTFLRWLEFGFWFLGQFKFRKYFFLIKINNWLCFSPTSLLDWGVDVWLPPLFALMCSETFSSRNFIYSFEIFFKEVLLGATIQNHKKNRVVNLNFKIYFWNRKKLFDFSNFDQNSKFFLFKQKYYDHKSLKIWS